MKSFREMYQRSETPGSLQSLFESMICFYLASTICLSDPPMCVPLHLLMAEVQDPMAKKFQIGSWSRKSIIQTFALTSVSSLGGFTKSFRVPKIFSDLLVGS